ncbi:MAG: hypothetical protein AAFZ65_17915, partial [Planctomycetota bacterium]
WFSDGTPAGTQILKNSAGVELAAYSASFLEYQGRVYFSASTPGVGVELFQSDGTDAGTTVVSDIAFGSESSFAVPLGSAGSFLMLAASPPGEGNEPWVTDGSASGTTQLANLSLDQVSKDSFPDQSRRFRDKVIFRAVVPGVGRELHVSDGTPGGTQLLADVRPGDADANPVPLTEIDAGLLFSVLPESTGQELWITDGTPQGTRQVGVFDDGFSPQGWTAQRVSDGLAYFFAPDMQGHRVWRTDGTPEGTVPVNGYPVVPSFSEDNEDRMLDGQWYFSAKNPAADESFELWRTDGSPSGTAYIGDLLPGPNPSAPADFQPLGDKTLFTAYTATGIPRQLWTTDGTLAGTTPLTALQGQSFVGPAELTVLGDRILFRVDDGIHGIELWTTDGTEAGTQLLVDLRPGPMSSTPRSLEVAGDELYFWANISDQTVGLYRTDGTSAGTVLISDQSSPGAPFELSSEISALGDGGLAAFTAVTATSGKELWVTDGTPAGTELFAQIAPGALSSNPSMPIRVVDQLFVRADDGQFGVEFHLIELDDVATPIAEPIGLGCGSSLAAATSAGFGDTLQLETVASTPFSLTALYLSLDVTFDSLGANCQLHLGDPLLVSTASTDAQSSSTTPIPIPSNPVLAGLPLYFQSVSVAAGGGLLGAFELSNAVEAITYP